MSGTPLWGKMTMRKPRLVLVGGAGLVQSTRWCPSLVSLPPGPRSPGQHLAHCWDICDRWRQYRWLLTVQQTPVLGATAPSEAEVGSGGPGPLLVPCLQAVGVAQRCSRTPRPPPGRGQCARREAHLATCRWPRGRSAGARGKATSQRAWRPWGAQRLPAASQVLVPAVGPVLVVSLESPRTPAADPSPEASPLGSLALAHVVRQASPARRGAAGQR